MVVVVIGWSCLVCSVVSYCSYYLYDFDYYVGCYELGNVDGLLEFDGSLYLNGNVVYLYS